MFPEFRCNKKCGLFKDRLVVSELFLIGLNMGKNESMVWLIHKIKATAPVTCIPENRKK